MEESAHAHPRVRIMRGGRAYIKFVKEEEPGGASTGSSNNGPLVLCVASYLLVTRQVYCMWQLSMGHDMNSKVGAGGKAGKCLFDQSPDKRKMTIAEGNI